MHPIRVPRTARPAALLLVGAILVAGCDDDSSPPEATPTVARTATPSASPTPTSQATATATTAAAITYELVPVGNPGNASDASGYGGVDDAYRIGRYEVTIGQYVAFLNAVAAIDTHTLYRLGMGADANVAGIAQTGSSGAFTYSVIPPAGTTPPGASSGPDRPITYVSWFAAARFANWMANGQPRGAQDETTTENGAYALKGATTGSAVARNETNPNTGAAPTFYIPTENEWYKAAYYDPQLDGGSGGYYAVATRSDGAPGNRIGGAANQVNYIDDATGYSIWSVTQLSNLDLAQNYLNDVGAFSGSGSSYGTYDQTGNVWEWTDRDGAPGPYRVIRGGAWTSTLPYLQSSLRLGYAPDGANSNLGFRLAAPAASSEPSMPPLALAGLACGAFGTVRRRRGKRSVCAATVARTLAAVVALATLAGNAGAVTIDMVTVGDAGNADDTTGFGAVAYDYQIAKYDVTIAQYAEFLNAVAATDPHSLYSTRMETDLAIAGIRRAGSPGSYTYSVMENGGDSGNRPITYVSWWDAARFANWMANGQPTGAQDATTTEDGAYALNGAISGEAAERNSINPNTDAAPTFSLPLENEWYKAAYYSSSLAEGAGGYYDYATQADTAPGNAIGSTANQANYLAAGKFSVTGGSSQEPGQNYLTDVGAFTSSASFYGTFDQNGNVWQWNDLDGTASASRGLRGGYWFSGSLALQALLFCNDSAARESNDVGFRLAGPAGGLAP